MFGLGFAHAFGPDHLAAITALARPGSSFARILHISVRFGAGHALLLFLFASLSLLFGYLPSEGAMRVAETVGGLFLMVLGAWVLHDTFRARSRHPDAGARGGQGTRSAGIWGSLFAISGTRSLLLAVGAATVAHDLAVALFFVAAFGLGIFAGMAAFGVLLAWGGKKFLSKEGMRRPAGFTTAGLSFGLGLYWAVAVWV